MPPLPRRTALFAALVGGIGIVAAACGGSGADVAGTINLGEQGLSPDVDDVQVPADGESLAGLTFATFEGATDGFDNHLGRPLVVNFFAAWCGPCRAEMPEFQQVFSEFEDRVGFLGISRDDTPDAALDLIAETGVTYPTGWDEDGALFPELGLFAMPTTLFLDADGVIVDEWAGLLAGDALRRKVEALL